jgi:serine-type D-Ala-D-Ala carboxypeptidase (penicillin-binding protein 5/6)
MGAADGTERQKGPAHARGRTLPKANEDRLTELGKHLPPPSGEEFQIIAGLRASRRRRRVLAWCAFLVVLALCAGAVAQWVRPIPLATVRVADARLPGPTPTLAWPTTGEAAVGVEGLGLLGQVRGTQSVPVAGLAQVLAAYVVLSDHPLATGGAQGPAISVDAPTLTSYQAGLANQESEVPVSAGESLTELQALEGLLVDSGGDMATLLAGWDAQSVTAFVAKMNTVAAKLGLSSTHITDPSGVDPGTTMSAEDLVRLGEAAMSIPVLRQMVSLGQASVPMTTVVYNLNFDLGRDGIIGVKTGSDSSAQGCFLFAAQQSIAGKEVTVVGAVLGQPGGSLGPNTTAVDAGDALVKSTFAALHSFTAFTPGQKAGEVSAPWGASTPLTVSAPVSVVGWPGLAVTATAHTRPPNGALPAGAVVGAIRTGAGDSATQVTLRTSAPLSAPGFWWRLTR